MSTKQKEEFYKKFVHMFGFRNLLNNSDADYIWSWIESKLKEERGEVIKEVTEKAKTILVLNERETPERVTVVSLADLLAFQELVKDLIKNI